MLLSTIRHLPKFQVLHVTILPATNKRGLRIQIASKLWGQTIKIPCNNTEGSDLPKIETAINWCEENGFPVIGFEDGNAHAYVVTSRVNPLHA